MENKKKERELAINLLTKVGEPMNSALLEIPYSLCHIFIQAATRKLSLLRFPLYAHRVAGREWGNMT